MRTNVIIIFLTMTIMTMLAGCSSGNSRAAEIFETARFEEKQNNLEHATKLYEEIVAKYPNSPLAKEAATRLADLKRTKP